MNITTTSAPMSGRMRDLAWCCPGHDPMFGASRRCRRYWVRIQRRRGKTDLVNLIREEAS
ncbi:hypothetical protein [Planomonospora sp. ID82291]|uniref:hypothetical protein n=1 Tax=Planomonospora sp. ID82291 TaxID=2738136 RepID=UPI0018C35A7B|nr:hypothetical protein [Planomonospora sp. ID82291]MBG0818278.1 hypothetical protein [Planomonospora sp. ID82291]